jgi:branched-chain amino acid transport system substrate-binding protein
VISRLRALLGSAALGAASLVAVAAAAQQEPIRLGLLTVKTGPLAAGGIQMEQGLNLCLKERGATLAGRKVALAVADTGGNPAGAKTKVQELVERDRVEVILGPLAAFEVYAIADYVNRAKVPLLPVAAAEDITQRKASPWFVRVLGSAAQDSHVTAHFAATELKLKRAITIADDFAYGHETVAGFVRVFEENGGRVVKKLWPPLNTADYTPYLAQIAEAKDVDAVFIGFAGSNPVKFIQQYASFGLKRVQLLGNGTAVDAPILRFLGEEGAGVVAAAAYSTHYDSPANLKFLEGMRRDYQVDPGIYSLATYLGCEYLDAALTTLGGRTDDREALAKALRSTVLPDSPRGPFRVDEYGNAVGNSFVRRTSLVNGKLTDPIVKTYEKVSQFWTYDPKRFLEQPVYSRDYPPAKGLE